MKLSGLICLGVVALTIIIPAAISVWHEHRTRQRKTARLAHERAGDMRTVEAIWAASQEQGGQR